MPRHSSMIKDRPSEEYLPFLYFAYGANLNRESMMHRCPAATPVGPYLLHDHRLVFRGVADIEYSDEESVWGVLWWITMECLDSLDQFEGYPFMYSHCFFDFEDTVFMAYKMNKEDGYYQAPAKGYFDLLYEGYQDFHLPTERLNEAYKYSTEKRYEYG